ncbi:hypothetical protein BDR22DRAFT_882551 [Usnea florida]
MSTTLARQCQIAVALHLQDRRTYASSTENLPRVAQPSIWHSIVPKAFRSPENSQVPAKPQNRKEWNPATFFICIFLLIGSNAIQMLTLKNEYSTFSRKADSKIKLLKEVFDRVQRGENVDVEKILGTGNEEQEQEWRDVIQDIEEESQQWHPKNRRQRKQRLQKEQDAEADSAEKAAEQRTASERDTGDSQASSSGAKRSPGFY